MIKRLSRQTNDIVSIGGLPADELEAAQLPTANVRPQGEFCGCEPTPQ
jgi:hypothetical protein